MKNTLLILFLAFGSISISRTGDAANTTTKIRLDQTQTVTLPNIATPANSAVQILGGGWVSGGGELIEDARNPWFLPNTLQVKYCISVDEANFGQSKNRLSGQVRVALEFWKTQFQNTLSTYFPSPYSSDVMHAQQQFQEVACGPEAKPDLVLQFGTLNGEQMKKIGDPTRYVGLTVRTDYDKVNLRGKGFIYFSPQSGPLQMDSQLRQGTNSKPWSEANGALVLPAIIHELGHVFGLTHSDGLHLMEERFLEELVAPDASHGMARFWEWMEVNQIYSKIRLFRVQEENPMPTFSLCSASIEVPSEPRPIPSLVTKSAKKSSKKSSRNYRTVSRIFLQSLKMRAVFRPT